MTKPIKILFFSLFCLSLSFCTKDKTEPNYSGKVFAFKNGSAGPKMRATTLPIYRNKVFFTFDSFDERGDVQQSIGIGNVAFMPDSNLLIENPLFDSTHVIMNYNPYSSFFLLNGGDILTGVYHVIENGNRWICIDGYNAATKEIRGRFEVSYVRDTSWSNISSPDSIHISGSFAGKIIER